MSNANDADRVKALLDQLRSSQAWQSTMGGDPAGPSLAAEASRAADGIPTAYPASTPFATLSTLSIPEEQQPALEGGFSSSAQPSVASLLSQLQNSPAVHALAGASRVVQSPPPVNGVNYEAPPLPDIAPDPWDAHEQQRATPPAAQKRDLRSATFQQALPIIAQLSEDELFIEAVRKLKEEQIQLEKRLWEERRALEKKHEDRVRVARTKATMIGVALSKFEADNMSDTFRRELQQFDRERVLPAWDGLIRKQQSRLESLGVPTMFPTTIPADRQKQQRVIQVLNGVAE